MTLFKTAYTYNPDGYSYYHLISGVDLPIKTQEYIHSYLEDKNENFLYYKENISIFDKARISRYRLRIHNKKMLEIFNIIQDKLNVDRMKNSKYEIKKGYNWASLTNDTVKLLLKHKKDIYKITFLSVCADEVYKQTILHYYNAKIYKNPDGKTDDLRFVDWGRGNQNHPYIFKSDDFNMLIESDKLFARKFDLSTDKEIIDRLYNYITTQNGSKI